ncbi:fucose 4-O-acetylase-like acetyltransferase [Leucobacter exalbidus]|uniref:Fucose 4-O-acetylase-like acetyltransferase n=1 Tax=Leucobacter exalbidus TaxID=662960 RepID=A0A940T1C6_9MICO|nr:fucose 4-O-acetylase-like acetyltransferase [Leucobacter exalbidus]
MSTNAQGDAPQLTPQAPARPPRIALWDNARFLLIVLVVIGHSISTVRTDSTLTFGLYTYIYLFHMPAMIFLSGFFSRPEVSPKAIKSTLQLIVVWLMWEGIWALIHLGVDDKAPGDRFLVSPAWTLWFLVSLATMRILLPYLAMLRRPLLLAVVLALVSGLVPAMGTEFSAARTLSFMPFFVAGWLASSRGWLTHDWFTKPTARVRAAGWGLLVAIGCLLAFIPNLYEVWRVDTWLTWRDDDAWLLRNAPIDEWHAPSEAAGMATGLGITLLLLVIATAMTLALLLVVPRGHSRITRWGTRTLFVYLLHAPIIWTLRETGAIDAIYGLGLGGVALLLTLSIALAVLLSTNLVARVTRPFIEPRITWLFPRDRQGVANGQKSGR